MTRKDTITASVAVAAILSVVGYIMFGSGDSKPGRSAAVSALDSVMSTDDLIRERASIVEVLNFSHDSPAAKPDRIEKLKANLRLIEEDLAEQGVDVSTLEPKPEWDT